MEEKLLFDVETGLVVLPRRVEVECEIAGIIRVKKLKRVNSGIRFYDIECPTYGHEIKFTTLEYDRACEFLKNGLSDKEYEFVMELVDGLYDSKEVMSDE